MQRVSRFAIVGAVLLGLIGLTPMKSPWQSLQAAPGLNLLRGRSTVPSQWQSRAPGGTPLLQRLLRYPAEAFAGGSPSPSLASPFALQFDGVNDRVSFGAAPGLGATNFTIETWFVRQGPGIAVNTGTGGVVALPLVTKGMAQAENSNQDMNYFLGIDTKTGALAADFEEFGSPGTPGLNHPIIGTTRITDGVWYHAAATYDSVSGAFRLYLNGALDASVAVGAGIRPRFDSIQHAALGAAFTSAGSYAPTTNGAFQGLMDEVRIWNIARDQASIAATMGVALPGPQSGLIGRYSLDEGTGTVANDTAGAATVSNGTLGGSTPAVAGGVPVWIEGPDFVSVPRPAGANGIKLTGLLPGTTAAQAGDYIALGPSAQL